jgi:hypothetical protein
MNRQDRQRQGSETPVFLAASRGNSVGPQVTAPLYYPPDLGRSKVVNWHHTGKQVIDLLNLAILQGGWVAGQIDFYQV